MGGCVYGISVRWSSRCVDLRVCKFRNLSALLWLVRQPDVLPPGDVFEGEEEYHVEVNAIGSVIGHEPATCEPKVRMRSLFTTSGLPLTHHSPCRTTATAILPIHHPTCHFTFYQPFQCICSKNACTVLVNTLFHHTSPSRSELQTGSHKNSFNFDFT